MIRLLQIEFIKLWNNRASKVLIIAYFILLTFISLVAAIKFDIGPIKFHLAELGIFDFPYIWHFNSFIAAFFKLFLAVVIVSMMANEYSNKTIKQNLIDGLSKWEFIYSKFLTVLALSTVSTLFLFIISFLLGLGYSSYDEISIIFSDLEFILAYFVKLVGFFSFCLFLGILVKRSAFALGFLILWAILEQLLFGLLGWKVTSWETANTIKGFFPMQAMSNLIDEPFTRLSAVQNLGDQIGEDFKFDYAVHWYEIIIVLAWTALFVYGSYALLKKRDL
ncbi:ABC transporter permease [Maribacter algarum]|uniref:ABC transporter permease n=1 Tax=Maribacter algarum (ex Zhang et al. 2020) TaxID=2578118 RepID=A0A5S3PGL5_9FLAO|nr:ABC transporter permease [Maribacter algarum]TMM53262.1 ABC transporter permease [Maribacter algarum]